MDFIFDIDGTLADCSHRIHFVREKPKNYRKFMSLLNEDTVVAPVKEVLDSLAFGDGNRIIFCTGRDEHYRAVTGKWLRDNLIEVTDATLYMRPRGDYRPDVDVKRDLLARIRADGFDPKMVFEDRSRVVDMWRKEGLICAQVAPGDY